MPPAQIKSEASGPSCMLAIIFQSAMNLYSWRNGRDQSVMLCWCSTRFYLIAVTRAMSNAAMALCAYSAALLKPVGTTVSPKTSDSH